MKNIETNIMAVKNYASEFLLFDDISVVKKYGFDIKQVKQKLKRKRKNSFDGYSWQILNDGDWKYWKELSEDKTMNNLVKYIR